MNKILPVGFLLACGLGWAWQSRSIPRGGSGYQVEFTGPSGVQMVGAAGWTDQKNSKTRLHMDKVEGTLPLTVSLTPPEGASVSASGMLMGKGDVTIKIFHNGIECGENPFAGTAALNAKVCRSR